MKSYFPAALAGAALTVAAIGFGAAAQGSFDLANQLVATPAAAEVAATLETIGFGAPNIGAANNIVTNPAVSETSNTRARSRTDLPVARVVGAPITGQSNSG